MASSVIERYTNSITRTIKTWLDAEVKSSGTDHNAVLDNYIAAVEGLRHGPGHPTNFTHEKHEGHMNRLKITYWPAYLSTPETDPDFDKIAATISFAGLMEVSGAYRNQCFIAAKGAEDYARLRQKAIGIGIDDIVAVRLERRLPSSGDFGKAAITDEVLEERLHTAIDNSDECYEIVVGRAMDGLDFGRPTSPSAENLMNDQANWIGFITDSIIMAAKKRAGNLAAVPLLDAQSISKEPQPYYPFRGEKPPVVSRLSA